MNLLLPLIFLAMLMLHVCDLCTLSKSGSRFGYHQRERHPLQYDLYLHDASRGQVKYADDYAFVKHYPPRTNDGFCEDLKACYLPTQRGGAEQLPVDVSSAILRGTCAENYVSHLEGHDTKPGYGADKHAHNRRRRLVCSKKVQTGRQPDPAPDASVDLLTGMYLLFADTPGGPQPAPLDNDAINEFQASTFSDVLAARFIATVGNPKISYNDGRIVRQKFMYGYYFNDAQFIDFLETMDQSNDPKARRFVSLDNFYALRDAACSNEDYYQLPQELKLEWARLVFSKLTLRLFALRDAYSEVLGLSTHELGTPEDFGEALYSYFTELRESGCGEVHRAVTEMYTKFDLFELAYVRCTSRFGDAPHLMEHGRFGHAQRLDHYLSEQVSGLIRDLLTVAKAYKDSPNGKIGREGLEKAAVEIYRYHRNNTDRSNGNCR
ncbi:hypothetical protein PAPHI01_2499 [Pancytospora philotis]|nr:hypothetical protein PAPHI01_2499 [Pancytospora philotis]